MKVALTAQARAELHQIGEWIERDSPANARRFVLELEEACLRLSEMPHAFPYLPRHRELGIRRRPYRRYVILYRIKGDVIEVLHVVHGARDYEALYMEMPD